jgi:hypothetical protein
MSNRREVEKYVRRRASLQSIRGSFGHPARLYKGEQLWLAGCGRKAAASAATGVCCIKKKTGQSGE